jgi:pyruvate dehydrogenase complex dehydrogenase (E1) component
MSKGEKEAGRSSRPLTGTKCPTIEDGREKTHAPKKMNPSKMNEIQQGEGILVKGRGTLLMQFAY